MADDAKRASQIARIRALMAKTVANGCTEAEAQSAAAAVDRLLADYEIELDDVAISKQEVVRLDIECFNHAVVDAVPAVAVFCDCKVWTMKSANLICFLGVEIDIEIAEYLVLMFKRSLDREGADYKLTNRQYALAQQGAKRSLLASFHAGMAIRLGDRLAELKGKRDFTRREAGGTALVVSKGPLIAAAFASLGLTLHQGRGGGRSFDPAAFAAGRSAADNVSINQGVRGASNRKISR